VAGGRKNSTVNSFYPVFWAFKVLYESLAVVKKNARHTRLDIEACSITRQAFHPFCGYTTAHLTGVGD